MSETIKPFFTDYNHEKHVLLRLTLNLELRNLLLDLKNYFEYNPPKHNLKRFYNQFLSFEKRIITTYNDMEEAEQAEKRKTKKIETKIISEHFDTINHYITLGLFPPDDEYNLMAKAYNNDKKKFSSISNRLNKQDFIIQLMSKEQYRLNLAYTSLLSIYHLLRYTLRGGSEWHKDGLHKVINLLIDEFEKKINKTQKDIVNYIFNKIGDADLTQKVVISQVLQAYNTDDKAMIKISEKILA